MKKLLSLSFLIIAFVIKSFGQTVAVGSYTESIVRRNQLLGLSDSSSSFTVQPMNTNADEQVQSMIASKNLQPSWKLLGVPSSVKILPFNWLNEVNTKLPYGYNNGPLYPNAGYQTMASGGIFIKAAYLNIQLKPEFVHAQNKSFPTFADVQAEYKSGLIGAFFQNVNGIDAPERFGTTSHDHMGLGQSKITLSYANMEIGASTENMWWGPGVKNSIMMSNSAPGFLHWTFNSTAPVKTPIGSFEWQLIGGRLKQSGYLPYDAGKMVWEGYSYKPKPYTTRYLSAFTINYQPKWIPGLFVGFSAFDYMNRDSVYEKRGAVKKILPVFFGSNDVANTINGGDAQDYAYAVNLRQVFPEYGSEVYLEYARNDRAATFRDFFMDPEHSAVYTIGGARVFKLNKQNEYMQLRVELTHMQLSSSFLVRPDPSWYVHNSGAPRDGYTNEGRYLGAGIGPGSNSLSFDLSYIKNQNSFGLVVERLVHNNDLFYNAFKETTTYYSHWVDIANTLYANVRFKKNYMISAEVTPVFVINYDYLQDTNEFNVHARLNLTYFFD